MSADPAELSNLVRSIKRVQELMGARGKHLTAAERESLPAVRRGAYAARNLAAGSRLTAADVSYLRPRAGLSPAEIDRRFGTPLAKPAKAGEALTAEHFS